MYPRWSQGKPPVLSAGGWNAAMDAAEAYARELRDQLVGDSGPSPPPGIIQVKNGSGAARARSHVLGLGTPIATLTSSQAQINLLYSERAFTGQVPDLELHRRKFVILDESIPQTAIGDGILQGLAVVKVDIVSEVHKFATIKNNDATQLQSSWWGRAHIIWQETGTGSKWCLVELGAFTYPHYRGKCSLEWLKGTTKTVTVWTGTGAAAASSGATIENVYNSYGDLEANIFARVGFDNDGPEVVGAECP